MLSEQLMGLILTACGKSATALKIKDENVDLGFTEALLHELAPHLRPDFPRAMVKGWFEKDFPSMPKLMLKQWLDTLERLWSGETEVTGDMVKSRGKPDSFGTTKHRYAVGSVYGTCGRSGEACGLQPGCCLNPHERAYRGCSGCEHFGHCPDCKPADDNPPPKMPYIPRQRGAERRQGEEMRFPQGAYPNHKEGNRTWAGFRIVETSAYYPDCRESQRRKETGETDDT